MMGKARPAVITWVLASLAPTPAGRARILHQLVKLVISEATFVAPGHGREKHTPAKTSYERPLQAAVSHSAMWVAVCLLFSTEIPFLAPR